MDIDNLYAHLALVASGQPGFLSNAEACRIAGDARARISELEDRALAVCKAWESGDLAAAVRSLWLSVENQD